MNIPSAAAAAPPSGPAMASHLAPAENGGGSGAKFADQLNGYTEEQPATSAAPETTDLKTVTAAFARAEMGLPATGNGTWRSAGPTKAPKKGDGTLLAPVPLAVPITAQPLLPYKMQLPFGFNAPVATAGADPTAQANNGLSATVLPLPVLSTPILTEEPATAPKADDRTDSGAAGKSTVKTPSAAAAGIAQRPQELAFAARVQPVGAVNQTAISGEMTAAAAASSAKKVVAGAASTAPSDVHAVPAGALAAFERNAEPAAPIHTEAAAPVSHSAEALMPQTESLAKPTAPLKDISLQVTQPGKESIDVRVVQQGSEVHVSVHSADAGLTSGLRQGLSELQGRLEENGYRAEMWRPTVAAAPLASSAATQHSSNHSRGGDGQPQSGGSQQDGGRRQQNQSNQPRWVKELESNLTSGDKSSGGSNGFTS